MNYNDDALPRGLNVRRLRVPNFGGDRPILAYDQVIDPDDDTDHTDFSLEEPELSLDDGEEIDSETAKRLIRRLLTELAEALAELRSLRGEDKPAELEHQPRRGGSMDRKAQDRKRGTGLGMDAASFADFYSRYPNSSKIKTGI